jgi:hypothetical protein
LTKWDALVIGGEFSFLDELVDLSYITVEFFCGFQRCEGLKLAHGGSVADVAQWGKEPSTNAQKTKPHEGGYALVRFWVVMNERVVRLAYME